MLARLSAAHHMFCMTREPSLNFERLAKPPEAPATRRRLELVALWCAAAGLVGTTPAYTVYVSRHFDWMPPIGWLQLVVQSITFVVVGGAWCGISIGAGLSFTVHAGLRFFGSVMLGGAASSMLGAIGAVHFGLLSLPYFGGTAILASIGLALFLAAVGFAHTESKIVGTALGYRACFACALAPLPLFLSVVAVALVVEPNITRLDLEAMRFLVHLIGLPLLGAGGGAFIGMLGAAWFASSALLAARWARSLSEGD